MSEVNTGQDPNDFAAMATNDDPADPNAAAAPAEPAPGQPTEPTPEEVKEQENAAQKITELGEARANLFKTTLGLVEGNPDLIKDIHESDPQLADEIVKEHWGNDSFDELMAHARVKELEETDPERAKTEQDLLDVQKSNKNILGQLKTSAEATFYKDKGIQNNPYDPKYKAIQAALLEVNPALIETNYAKALENAYNNAFPGRTEVQIAEDIKKITLATAPGTPVAPGAGSPPPTPSTTTDAQQNFMQNVGVKPV